ncbi:MAG: ABC-F family ATP-binding cassette domain-containing protein [Flavobacteriales bacterium]|nr:ABC-F family ATP-binding cassette domain-containing protein [Flavobacteriales bacterium]
MNYLSVEQVSKSYGIKVLFSGISFGIQQGQKIALVARNGSGKTSLLKIMAGKDLPDDGQVVVRNSIRIGYLEQSPFFNGKDTVLQALFAQDNEVMAAIRNYEQALKRYESNKTDENYAELIQYMQQMDLWQAWDLEAKVRQILAKLNIHDVDSPIETLSGGQLKRVALAGVLISQPDLLILDEPTNHLDIDMIEWLEDYLATPGITLFMVTHDRYFLDNVCTDIFELDGGKMYQYHGNYAYFLEKKADRESAALSEVDKARNLYSRELEWVRKMPKARGTKSKSRLDKFEEIREKAFSLRKHKEIEINLRMKRMGNKILEVMKVSKRFGDRKLFEKFTYSFRKGERIGIVGSNGSGKSTFLKLITSQLPPDEGKIIIGDTIEFGYYGQQGFQINDDKRVIEVIREIAEVIEVDKSARITASQMLTRFDFPPEVQYSPVGKLSGGEKRRLYLLTVLLRNPNFLILDEPTNDLDILTLQKLEEYLETFQGCIIIVSHDRYFLDKLVDQIFVFKGDGKVEIFGGSYTEYRLKQELEDKNLEKEALPSTLHVEQILGKEKKKLSYKEKLEFEQIEKELPLLENEKSSIEAQLMQPMLDHQKLLELTTRLSELTALIDQKTDRWLELSEWTG